MVKIISAISTRLEKLQVVMVGFSSYIYILAK